MGMVRYAITDRTLLGKDEEAQRAGLRRYVEFTAEHGISFLQVREKDLQPAALVEVVRELASGLVGTQVKLLVNGRCDVAVAGGADGVHLTSSADELTPWQVRTVFARVRAARALVSVSCHTVAEVKRFADGRVEDRPDMILFGPVFEKRIADEQALEGTGLELLREACTAAGALPVLALGGVDGGRSEACVHAGAAGFAAIRMFLPPPDGFRRD